MRKGIYILPNAITLCGTFAGFFAIISAVKGNFVIAAWAVIIASVFDGLDGWVARATGTTTKFGIELDSLSDVIAFGVAPAVLSYQWALQPFNRVGWAVAFMFTACGALRLARFNIQMGSTEKKTFTGMPIPAAAVILSSMVIFYDHMGWTPTHSVFVLMVTVVISLLMVSTLRFHSHKELKLRERKPFLLLVVFVVLVAVIAMRPEVMLFMIGMTYLGIGLAENAYLLFVKHEKP
jgi:CDP-diacylglycerol--serine O-phosphatidyltransferase